MTIYLDKEKLRERLIASRKSIKYKQAQLAKEAEITPAALSQIEKGIRVPTTPVIHKIASVLGVSLDYLVGKTEKSELKDLLQNKNVNEFYKRFQSLRTEDQETILKNIDFLLSNKKAK